MRIDSFILIYKVIIILEVLEITSLNCALFLCLCFSNMWWWCIYTIANDVKGNRTRTPYRKAEKWKYLFYFKYFVLILCKNLKSLQRGIYFKT